MWLWLLIPLINPSWHTGPELIRSADAVETSSGPASAQEARILWSDGKKAYDQARYQDAVNLLKRFVDRYPGYKGYLDAHRLLGRSLMLLGRYNEAIQPLQQYVSDTGDRELGLRARLWLGQDELKLSKSDEAYLLSVEIQKAAKKQDPELYLESEFLKARSLIALNRNEAAGRVLDAIDADPLLKSHPLLRGKSAQARIELQLRKCSKFPPHSRMNEAQAREQFNQRALCLREALVLFKTAASSGVLGSGKSSADRILAAYEEYAKAVRNPPPPPRLQPKPRTPKQLRQYRLELADRLVLDLKSALADTLSTLALWKKAAHPETAKTFAALSKRIQALKQGNSL